MVVWFGCNGLTVSYCRLTVGDFIFAQFVKLTIFVKSTIL